MRPVIREQGGHQVDLIEAPAAAYQEEETIDKIRVS